VQLIDGFFIPDGDLPKHHIADSVVQHDAILHKKGFRICQHQAPYG